MQWNFSKLLDIYYHNDSQLCSLLITQKIFMFQENPEHVSHLGAYADLHQAAMRWANWCVCTVRICVLVTCAAILKSVSLNLLAMLNFSETKQQFYLFQFEIGLNFMHECIGLRRNRACPSTSSIQNCLKKKNRSKSGLSFFMRIKALNVIDQNERSMHFFGGKCIYLHSNRVQGRLLCLRCSQGSKVASDRDLELSHSQSKKNWATFMCLSDVRERRTVLFWWSWARTLEPTGRSICSS